jgi:hypothetical protein
MSDLQSLSVDQCYGPSPADEISAVGTHILFLGAPPTWGGLLLIFQKEMQNEKTNVCVIVDRQFCIRWCRQCFCRLGSG